MKEKYNVNKPEWQNQAYTSVSPGLYYQLIFNVSKFSDIVASFQMLEQAVNQKLSSFFYSERFIN